MRRAERIIIAAQSDGGSLVEPVAGARPTVIRTGLGSPLDLAWTDQAQEQLIVADTAGSRILLVDLSQPGIPPTELYTGIGKLWGARLLANGRLVIGAGDSLLLGDFLRPQVELRPLSGKLFIGGWTHVRVRINDPAIAFDDLEFSVDPAASGAMVSYARDNSFDPNSPHHHAHGRRYNRVP